MVGIIQSNYIPWRGYFDFISQCDHFVFLDDVQYTQRDWRNRNLIKTANGLKWLTVPVVFSRSRVTAIDRTPVNYQIEWQREHLKWLKLAYGETPFFQEYYEAFSAIIGEKQYETISELNQTIIKWLLDCLNIRTPVYSSRELYPFETKTKKLLAIVKHLGGKVYLSGPSARSYIDNELLDSEGIELRYKEYEYPNYDQIYPPFVGGVSVLDLLFHCGPQAVMYLRSLVSNQSA